MKKVCFGGIDFINAYPLVRSVKETENCLSPVNLTLAMPSQLGEKLIQHTLDVAMIPTYTFLENALPVLSGRFVIASDGPVKSVRLYCKASLDHGALVALDAKSRTSVRMLKILLMASGYENMRYVILPYEAMILRKDIDAFLLIGDDNFKPGLLDKPIKIDLGKWWKELFEIPFVYAVIASFESDFIPPAHTWLNQNYSSWIQNREFWIKTWSQSLGIPGPDLLKYLTKNIRHTLNPGQVESGVQLFQDLCVKYGLLRRANPFQVFDCSSDLPFSI